MATEQPEVNFIGIEKSLHPLIAEFFRTEARIPGPEDPLRTNYEAKYRREGRGIYEVRFWRNG